MVREGRVSDTHPQAYPPINCHQVGFKMMAYPAILDKVKGTPIKVRMEGRRGQVLSVMKV